MSSVVYLEDVSFFFFKLNRPFFQTFRYHKYFSLVSRDQADDDSGCDFDNIKSSHLIFQSKIRYPYFQYLRVIYNFLLDFTLKSGNSKCRQAFPWFELSAWHWFYIHLDLNAHFPIVRFAHKFPNHLIYFVNWKISLCTFITSVSIQTEQRNIETGMGIQKSKTVAQNTYHHKLCTYFPFAHLQSQYLNTSIRLWKFFEQNKSERIGHTRLKAVYLILFMLN